MPDPSADIAGCAVPTEKDAGACLLLFMALTLLETAGFFLSYPSSDPFMDMSGVSSLSSSDSAARRTSASAPSPSTTISSSSQIDFSRLVMSLLILLMKHGLMTWRYSACPWDGIGDMVATMMCMMSSTAANPAGDREMVDDRVPSSMLWSPVHEHDVVAIQRRRSSWTAQVQASTCSWANGVVRCCCCNSFTGVQVISKKALRHAAASNASPSSSACLATSAIAFWMVAVSRGTASKPAEIEASLPADAVLASTCASIRATAVRTRILASSVVHGFKSSTYGTSPPLARVSATFPGMLALAF